MVVEKSPLRFTKSTKRNQIASARDHDAIDQDIATKQAKTLI